MADLSPGIISKDFSDISQKIERLEGLVDWVHIDIMDDTLVKRSTWSAPEDLKQIGGKIKIEAHLMIAKPEDSLIGWLENVDRVIVHIEATDKLPEIAEAVANTHCRLALGLKLQTPVESVYTLLEDSRYKIDTVLLMSIAELGYSGEPFEKEVLNKIKNLHSKFPNVTIKADGGISLETGAEAVKAGANSLVATSDIWESENVEQIIKEFQKL